MDGWMDGFPVITNMMHTCTNQILHTKVYKPKYREKTKMHLPFFSNCGTYFKIQQGMTKL